MSTRKSTALPLWSDSQGFSKELLGTFSPLLKRVQLARMNQVAVGHTPSGSSAAALVRDDWL